MIELRVCRGVGGCVPRLIGLCVNGKDDKGI